MLEKHNFSLIHRYTYIYYSIYIFVYPVCLCTYTIIIIINIIIIDIALVCMYIRWLCTILISSFTFVFNFYCMYISHVHLNLFCRTITISTTHSTLIILYHTIIINFWYSSYQQMVKYYYCCFCYHPLTHISTLLYGACPCPCVYAPTNHPFHCSKQRYTSDVPYILGGCSLSVYTSASFHG